MKMPRFFRSFAPCRVVRLTIALLGPGVAWAFPPAPYYTLYGMVRDQVGQTVTAEGAEVSERVKLDLTLGEDLDKDGLPDTWEAWQLYQAGLHPDENGRWDLSLLDKNGDFDKDGQSNLLEYIAGTFAGDATETFSLAIKEKLAESVRLEFYGITGKVYTIESTLDMKTWTRVPFAVGAPGTGAIAHQAGDVGIVSAFTAPRSSSSEFYRLSVR